MNKKVINLVVILVIIISATLAIAAPALAAASCQYNPQHGWHIVGGSETDHWYETETECLIALQVPTALATLQTTPEVTETVSPEPTEPPVITETSNPTDEPTNEPTEPPVVTETLSPTDIPTDQPTEVVPTWTPDPSTPVPPTSLPAYVRKGLSCQRAWDKITNTVYEREVGFRFFENPNHSYCEAWLLKTHGIVWDVYKVLYPLETNQ